MSSAERSPGKPRPEGARRQRPASHGDRGTAMAAGLSPPIMDSAILFERHSVDEVRQMERKTRQDIERKKEDLRQMVGERYRDLIDAADTVGEMKLIAENVSNALAVMQTHCRQLKDLHLVKGAVRSDVDPSTRPLKERSEVYGMACQIRLLLGIPEMIWAALDSGAALEAAQLFLLARHVYTLLQLDPRVTGSGGSSSAGGTASGSVFPLVSKQWTAISHFKGAILEMCRTSLRATDATDQQIAESLGCIVLLEDKSTRQAFQEFLVARSYTVQQQPQQAGVKRQVCRAVTNVRTTVQQIFAVFCEPGAAGITAQPGAVPASDLLMATLTNVTSCSADVLLSNCIRCGDDHVGLLKHLPKSVTDFRPTLLVPPTSLSATYLQDNCSKWLDTCLHNLQTGVTGLLGYVGNASALASVRDAVWDALSLALPGTVGAEGGIQSVAASSWDIICSCLLGRTLDIWRDVLAQLFVTRSKDIIESQLAAIQRSCEDNVQRALDVFADGKSDGSSSSSEGTASTAGNAMSNFRDAGWSMLFERDAQAFVWTEHASDVGANVAWTPAASQTFTDGGGLKMKAHGLTPAVQSVAKQYDSQIDTLAKDVQCYTRRNANEVASIATGRSGDSTLPYLQLDSAAVEACLSSACTDQARRLISFMDAALETQIELLQQQLRRRQQQKEAGSSMAASSDDGRRPDAVDRVLLLARLCTAFYWLCPNLKRCVTMVAGGSASAENAAPATGWTAGAAASTKAASGSRLASSSAAGSALAPHWADIVQLLRSVSDRAHSAWSDYVLDGLLHGLKASLLAQHSADFSKRLHHITRWDEIDIEEESEEGREVRSKIVVPMQASPFIQELVYTLCREIGLAGGHNMRRHIVRRLISSLVSRLLRCYELVQNASSLEPKKGSGRTDEEQEDADEDGVLVTQSSALQCLFDVSFLKGLLSWKGEPAETAALERQFSSVVDFLQSKIDPFDLDVFTPHLQRHIYRQCQRSMVLLGTVSDAEKLSSAGLSSAAATGTKGGAAGQQYADAHNLLPLGGAASGTAGNSSLGRFPLLPVASNSSPATSLQQTLQQLPGRTVGGTAASAQAAAAAAAASTRAAAGKSAAERSTKENHLPPALRHSATEPAFKLAAPSFYDKLGSMFGGGSAAGSNTGSSGSGSSTGRGS